MEKIGKEEGVTTNAIATQSKVNNVSLWYCDGSEKGVTACTSLLVEASKSRIDDCAGKGGGGEQRQGRGNWRLPEDFWFSNWA